MTRLGISLAEVPSEVRCAKPACEVASHSRLQRHHKGHQKMWFYIWARRRRGEERFRAFKVRYKSFLPADVVLICDRHHPEIHALYDRIINEDRELTRLNLKDYSWPQAERLMRKLSDACDKWLTEMTPGLDPGTFDETRALYKSILRRAARKKRR